MTLYLCSTAAALAACLAAQPAAERVGLLTTGAWPPAKAAVHWAAVATVTEQSLPAAIETLRTCTRVVVAADLPVGNHDAQLNLCASIEALAAKGTTMIFAANAAPLAGHRLDMPSAELLPDTIVAAGLSQTPDPALLVRIGGPRRLLVLEGSTYVAYMPAQRTITIHGSGCVLVVTMPAAAKPESLRIMADVLTAGMSQVW